MSDTLHATAVAIGGQGVLLLGRSGSGKSDLALRLMDRGAELVADDRVVAEARDGRLWLSAPPRLAGLIELRGLGVHGVPFRACAMALLGFDLDSPPERLPAIQLRAIAGVSLPVLPLCGLEPSAPLRVEWALAALVRDGVEGFDVDRRFEDRPA